MLEAENGRPALLEAVCTRHSVNGDLRSSSSLFQEAIGMNNLSAVKVFLAHGAHLIDHNQSDLSQFVHKKIADKHIAVALELLEMVPQLACNEQVICAALESEDVTLLNDMKHRGFEVNANRFTNLLEFTMYFMLKKSALWLLDNDFKLNPDDPKFSSSLNTIVNRWRSSDQEIADFLQKLLIRPAFKRLIDREEVPEMNPLISAVQQERIQTTETLLSFGANAHVEDKYDRNLLMIAADKGSEALFKLLLARGVSPEERNSKGQTVEDYCRASKREEAKRCLLILTSQKERSVLEKTLQSNVGGVCAGRLKL